MAKRLIGRSIARLIRSNQFFAKCISDESYLKLAYKNAFNKGLNLDNPVTFNEKIQWLKLHDRNPLYTTLVDKHAVKEWVSSKIGPEHVIPTLAVWDKPIDIDINSLPSQFVIKCTHDSGGLSICTNRDDYNFDSELKKISRSFNSNFYYVSREWPYKNVHPRIIAEPYMVDATGYELRDYKFFCFDGEPKIMFIASDRSNAAEETKFDFYDMEFNRLPIENGHPSSVYGVEIPEKFEEMKSLAKVLSQGIPQVRVDFYEINHAVYFGEMTFAHWGGLVPFKPESWDVQLGEWINLSGIKSYE